MSRCIPYTVTSVLLCLAMWTVPSQGHSQTAMPSLRALAETAPSAPKWPNAFVATYEQYDASVGSKLMGNAVVYHYENPNGAKYYRVDSTTTQLEFAITIVDSAQSKVFALNQPAGKDSCFTSQPLGNDITTSDVLLELVYEIELGLRSTTAAPKYIGASTQGGRLCFGWEVASVHANRKLTYYEDVFERIPVAFTNSVGTTLVLGIKEEFSYTPASGTFDVSKVLCPTGQGKLPRPVGDPAYPQYFTSRVSQSFQRGTSVGNTKVIYHNGEAIKNSNGDPIRSLLRTDLLALDDTSDFEVHIDKSVTDRYVIAAGKCSEEPVPKESIPIVPMASELAGAQFLGYGVVRDHFCVHWNLTNKRPDEDIEYYEDFFTRLPVSLKSTKLGKTYSTFQYLTVDVSTSPLPTELFAVPLGTQCNPGDPLPLQVPFTWTARFRGAKADRIWYVDYVNTRQRFDIPETPLETHVSIAKREVSKGEKPKNPFAQYEISSNPEAPCHITTPVPDPMIPVTLKGTYMGLVSLGEHICYNWSIPADSARSNSTMYYYEDAFSGDIVRLEGLIALQPVVEFTSFKRDPPSPALFEVPTVFACSADKCEYKTCGECLTGHSVCQWCFSGDGGRCTVRSDTTSPVTGRRRVVRDLMSSVSAREVLHTLADPTMCTTTTTNPEQCPAVTCPQFANCTECLASGLCGWCLERGGEAEGAGCVAVTPQTNPPTSTLCTSSDIQKWFLRECPAPCPLSCSGHGTCNTRTGICQCDGAYGGGGCEIPLNAGVSELLINASSISGIGILIFCILGLSIWWYHKYGAGSQQTHTRSPQRKGQVRDYEELNSYPSESDPDDVVGIDVEERDITQATTPGPVDHDRNRDSM